MEQNVKRIWLLGSKVKPNYFDRRNNLMNNHGRKKRIKGNQNQSLRALMIAK